jgi:hypothetical protein
MKGVHCKHTHTQKRIHTHIHSTKALTGAQKQMRIFEIIAN